MQLASRAAQRYKRGMQIAAPIRHSLILAALASLIAHCAPIIDKRGAVFNSSQLRQLKIQKSDKAQVNKLFGNPSVTSMGQQERWYYISSTFVTRGMLAPRETGRRVLALAFDKNGVLRSFNVFGKKDGNIVAFVDRETPTRGKDLSALRQIFSNLGRFGAPGSTPGAAP